MLKFSARILAVSTLAALLACHTLQTAPTPAQQFLTQRQLATEQQDGTTHVHASGARFPPAVGRFRRTRMVQYDPENESAEYAYLEGDDRVAVTVYVSPSPSLTSIGSPPEVVERARTELCRRHFAEVREAIEERGGAPILERDGDIRLVQDGAERAGFSAIYRFDRGLGGGWPGPTRSEVHVFCYVGERWTVKYRISYPAERDVGPIVGAFLQEWQWGIRSRRS